MKLIYVLMLALSIVTLSACTSNDVKPVPTEDRIEMTLEELSFFDGREGRKAYIAVEGNIYDVSNSSLWPNGSHNGYQAGQDLTIPIMSSPHGLSTLKGVPLIGTLVEMTEEVPLDEDNNIETVIDDVVVEESDPEDLLLSLTLEELAAFDGREGRKAYIAVDGNIYDVSNSSLWPNGSHNGYQAGQDLTNQILNLSPHGLSTLDGIPLIGTLVEKTEEDPIEEENPIEEEEPIEEEVIVPEEVLLKLTLEELAAFDGREGRKAYIAVSGNIYDVTNSPLWPNGSHNGYQAGQDLTNQILNLSPHGLSTLDGIPIIGTLVETTDEEPLEEEVEPEDQLLSLTLQELAAFDGRDGRKGYIAVNGIIYDVTNSSLWPNGNHNGYQAGQDLTIPIMSSPHGLSTLSRLPIVGTLVSPKS